MPLKTLIRACHSIRYIIAQYKLTLPTFLQCSLTFDKIAMFVFSECLLWIEVTIFKSAIAQYIFTVFVSFNYMNSSK